MSYLTNYGGSINQTVVNYWPMITSALEMRFGIFVQKLQEFYIVINWFTSGLNVPDQNS